MSEHEPLLLLLVVLRSHDNHTTEHFVPHHIEPVHHMTSFLS